MDSCIALDEKNDTDIDTDPCYSRPMDTDMALGGSMSLDNIVASEGSAGY